MKKLDTTPKKDGFRMPAEFEPHRGSYIIWPERPDNWRLGAKPAQKVFLEVIKKILIEVERSNPKPANNYCAFILISASIEILVEVLAI